VSGPFRQMTWILGCPTSLDNWNIHIDNSLLRAQTDYIDIYQLHWPDGYVLMFRETYYDPARQYSYISFDEQLATLGKAVDAGKIRLIGVSNETPYEVMKFLQAAEKNPAYPRILTSGTFLARSDGGANGLVLKDIFTTIHKDADKLFKKIGEA
ncbi:aldo-keto reductase, partial [Tanacetum coccineum]